MVLGYDNDNNDNITLMLCHISKLGSLIGALHKKYIQQNLSLSNLKFIYVQLKTFSEQMSFQC